MSDPRIQGIIDDLRTDNIMNDEKEAYQDTFRRNVLIIAGLELLQRQQAEQLLTCAGCQLEPARKLTPLVAMDRCQRCTRLPNRKDAYDPKVVQHE